MDIENERRFLVLKMDKSILRKAEKQHIDQGYLDLAFPSFTDFRFRVIGGKKAILGIKRGVGVSRQQYEKETDLETIEFLREAQPHLLHKIRHIPKEQPENEKWFIDFFEGPLKGIIFAEVELKTPDQKFSRPEWLQKALEITDSVSNLHLARLATDLGEPEERQTPVILYDFILKSIVPRILLVGGPCSGKSSIMEIIAQEKKNILHPVPEVATILISQVGKKPGGSKLKTSEFNRTLYRLQRIFEATSAEEVATEGKRAMVLDRGTLDSAACMGGGLPEFERLLHTNKNLEYSQYDIVIFLEMPSREIYEKYKEDNPARTETYKEAVAQSERLKNVWGEHPNFHVIPETENWEEKLKTVEEIINEFLDQKTAEN